MSEQHTKAEYEALQSKCAKLTKALRKISNINTPSCEKYVAIADGIATDALVENDDEHYSSEMSLLKQSNTKLLEALEAMLHAESNQDTFNYYGKQSQGEDMMQKAKVMSYAAIATAKGE